MPSATNDELRNAGLRVTEGRLRVLGMLESRPHSDASSLHGALHSDGYRTSVQSVHNILGDLVGAGIIRRIELGGSAARYERRALDNHHHIVCISCSTIVDVDCAVGRAPCLHPESAAGFTIASTEVTFRGLCAGCSATAETRADTTSSELLQTAATH